MTVDRQYLSAVGMAGYGIGLALLYLVQWSGIPAEILFRTVPFLFIAGGVAYSGVWLLGNETFQPYADWVFGWTLGGGLTFGALGTLVVLNHWMAFAIGSPALQTILDAIAGGSLAGTVVGLYDAQSRHRFAELRTERDRIEQFAKKAASLNRYAKVLNEATHVEEVSALSLEVVQLLIGSREGLFLVVDGEETRVLDSTHSSPEAFRELAGEIAEAEPMEIIRCPEDTTWEPPRDCRDSSIVALPIPAGTDRTVIILALSESSQSYRDEDLELLELLAAHMATAIEDIEFGEPLAIES